MFGKNLRAAYDALRAALSHTNDPARVKAIKNAEAAVKAVPKPAPKPPVVRSKLWLPGATRNPIPQSATDPSIRVAGAVFHIAVTNATSLKQQFENDGGIESTGYILQNGIVEQYRPLNVECDAQFAGNSWLEGTERWGLASFENQGGVPNGEGLWTPEQVTEIKAIIRFIHEQHGVPLRQCETPTGPGAHGFGYHRLFDEWNVNHHSCPGDQRVAQWHRVIVPWLKAGAPA